MVHGWRKEPFRLCVIALNGPAGCPNQERLYSCSRQGGNFLGIKVVRLSGVDGLDVPNWMNDKKHGSKQLLIGDHYQHPSYLAMNAVGEY
jgi:hypothetical protein